MDGLCKGRQSVHLFGENEPEHRERQKRKGLVVLYGKDDRPKLWRR